MKLSSAKDLVAAREAARAHRCPLHQGAPPAP